tara:strand:- start:766 stop:939 length:174 start_codon:yes stop_codon:yes gene_type:complete
MHNGRLEPWIDLHQAHEYTKLSIVKLRRAYNNNEFKVSRVTGKVLTKKSWLDEWLDK